MKRGKKDDDDFEVTGVPAKPQDRLMPRDEEFVTVCEEMRLEEFRDLDTGVRQNNTPLLGEMGSDDWEPGRDEMYA